MKNIKGKVRSALVGMALWAGMMGPAQAEIPKEVLQPALAAYVQDLGSQNNYKESSIKVLEAFTRFNNITQEYASFLSNSRDSLANNKQSYKESSSPDEETRLVNETFELFDLVLSQTSSFQEICSNLYEPYAQAFKDVRSKISLDSQSQKGASFDDITNFSILQSNFHNKDIGLHRAVQQCAVFQRLLKEGRKELAQLNALRNTHPSDQMIHAASDSLSRILDRFENQFTIVTSKVFSKSKGT